MTLILKPKEEFEKSAGQVLHFEQDIGRLLRQADIALLNMKQDEKVDLRACAAIVGKACELRLIDEGDLQDMSFKDTEQVEAAFKFIKMNTTGILDIAHNPSKYEALLAKEPDRLSTGERRRHFSALTS